jgi:hypothetical protein
MFNDENREVIASSGPNLIASLRPGEPADAPEDVAPGDAAREGVARSGAEPDECIEQRAERRTVEGTPAAHTGPTAPADADRSRGSVKGIVLEIALLLATAAVVVVVVVSLVNAAHHPPMVQPTCHSADAVCP